MEKRFSKIFSIVVYAFLALWMGACKSEPVRLPELSGHRGSGLYCSGEYAGFGGFMYKV
ncbi:hypothetical protein NXV14_21695 [Bacteroides fragilis]|nr:hypothetical protein [Bacteroides fragilis]